MKEKLAVGLGEILWDIFPSGKVLGGAPANFAYQINSLGIRGLPISSVGSDMLGKEIINVLSEKSLSTELLQVNHNFETGKVEVTLDNSGIPTYEIKENVAWDNIDFTFELKKAAKKCDAICFGSLAQRNEKSRNTIMKFLADTSPNCLKVFDINLRQNYYSDSIIIESLQDATALKLNNEELEIIKDILGIYGSDESLVAQIMDNYQLQQIALTMGEKGSFVYFLDQESYLKPKKIKIIDTVGAGDAFTAGLVYGILNDFNIDHTHTIANNLASFVCSMAGATPTLDDELKQRIINT
ncbi:MAG: carbohydrate kinase [Melioribacteraceae bacterium]|nr:carbohydrate kinase [Melioribacteraceae bacterium]